MIADQKSASGASEQQYIGTEAAKVAAGIHVAGIFCPSHGPFHFIFTAPVVVVEFDLQTV